MSDIKKKLRILTAQNEELARTCKLMQEVMHKTAQALTRATKSLDKVAKSIYEDKVTVEIDAKWLVTVIYLDDGKDPIDYLNIKQKGSYAVHKVTFYRNRNGAQAKEALQGKSIPNMSTSQLNTLANVLNNIQTPMQEEEGGLLN